MRIQFRSLKLVVPLLVYLGIGFLADPGNAHAFEVNPELEQFEKSLEERLQERIRNTFGSDARVAVSVHAQIEKVAPSPVPKRKSGSLARLIEGGYAPFPIDLNESEPESEVSEKGVKVGLKISQVDIGLQVADDLDAQFVTDVKTLLKSTLQSYSPNIQVMRVALPRRVPSPTPLASPKAPDDKTATEKSKSEDKSLLNVLLPQLGTLLGALILSGALLAIGLGLKSSVGSIADGLKINAATRSEVTLKDRDSPEVSGGANRTEINGASISAGDADAQNGQGAASGVSLKTYGRNIKLIQQILKEEPSIFVHSLRDVAEDWNGLRSLLPCLSPEDMENLKRCLGSTRITRLASSQETPRDPSGWLREFVERMMLKKVQGGNQVEKMLGAETTIALTMAESGAILAAAKNLNNRASWRIATSFVPKDLIKKELESMDESQWRLLINGSEVTAQEVTDAADRILQEVKNSVPSGAESELLQTLYFRETLLEPVVQMISGKLPGEDETLLNQLDQLDARFASMVKTKVWTIGQLALVPDEDLARTIAELTHEEKGLLLYALPEVHSTRIESLLPAGNVKAIVADYLRLVRGRNSVDEKKAAFEVSRRFLDGLRQQVLTKKIKLRGDSLDESNEDPRAA